MKYDLYGYRFGNSELISLWDIWYCTNLLTCSTETVAWTKSPPSKLLDWKIGSLLKNKELQNPILFSCWLIWDRDCWSNLCSPWLSMGKLKQIAYKELYADSLIYILQTFVYQIYTKLVYYNICYIDFISFLQLFGHANVGKCLPDAPKKGKS